MEDIPVCCIPCIQRFQAHCTHPRSSCWGGFHLSHGEVWDDIREVCDVCGALLSGLPHQPETLPEKDEIPI